EGGAGALLRSEATLPRLLEIAVARFPRLRDLALTIDQADLTWSIQTFLLLSAGLGVGAGVAAFASTGKPVLGLTFALFGAYLPKLYVGRRRRKRFRAFEAQLPDA